MIRGRIHLLQLFRLHTLGIFINKLAYDSQENEPNRDFGTFLFFGCFLFWLSLEKNLPAAGAASSGRAVVAAAAAAAARDARGCGLHPSGQPACTRCRWWVGASPAGRLESRLHHGPEDSRGDLRTWALVCPAAGSRPCPPPALAGESPPPGRPGRDFLTHACNSVGTMLA